MEKRKSFGWANGWRKTPEEVKECGEKGHKMRTKSLSGNPYRGTDTLCWCDECGIEYHVDSSD